MYLLSFLISNRHIAGLCGIAPPFTLLDHTSCPLGAVPMPLMAWLVWLPAWRFSLHRRSSWLLGTPLFLGLPPFLAAAEVGPRQQQLAAVLGFRRILLLLDRVTCTQGLPQFLFHLARYVACLVLASFRPLTSLALLASS
jgi:hypothetical protein